MTVRTRFAPSPTGQVHIGNIRAAIYNWLFARHEGGQFLLRIEDTDRERSTPAAVQAVLDAMAWLGLNYDEAPVYQSKQIKEHIDAVARLIVSGAAYRYTKPESKETVVMFGIPWDADKLPGVKTVGPSEIFIHPGSVPQISRLGILFSFYRQGDEDKEVVVTLRSLAGFQDLRIFDRNGHELFSLNDKIDGLLQSKSCDPIYIHGASKFCFTRRSIVFHDLVKGKLEKPLDGLSDFIITRSNGLPVFHLANVVDDINQKITHVIRGDDHIENTYRHIFLFHALGASPPKYAHLPMIVNAQGKPYSKRDGAAYVGDFRAKGYLGEALFNYLALLGWSPGGDRELMSRDEMARLFTFDRVQSSAAQFDHRKLLWMNGEYMEKLPLEILRQGYRSELERTGLWHNGISQDYLDSVIKVMEHRVNIWSMVCDSTVFFFTEDFPFDEKSVQKRLMKEGALKLLAIVRDAYAKLTEFTASSTEQSMRDLAGAGTNENPIPVVGMGDLVHPVRVAVSGTAVGPSLFHMLEVLGKERTLARMDRALAKFGSSQK